MQDCHFGPSLTPGDSIPKLVPHNLDVVEPTLRSVPSQAKAARPPKKANAANAIPVTVRAATSLWSSDVASDDDVADAALVELVALPPLSDVVADEGDAFENAFWLVI